MDFCEKYGFKVIFQLIGQKNYILNANDEEINQLLMAQIDEVGNHSGL